MNADDIVKNKYEQ